MRDKPCTRNGDERGSIGTLRKFGAPEALNMETVRNSAIVIIGAQGDLSRRKLVPALCALVTQGLIGEGCMFVGSGLDPMTDEEFRLHVNAGEDLVPILRFHHGIKGLKKFLDSLGNFERTIVFFSLPPSVYAEMAAAISAEGFGPDTRIIVEKPFGYDLESARELNQNLQKHFPEHNIYRIDHYLAKEAVQNLLVFRFANTLFDPIWNSGHVESIQISATESLGVESRGTYFDGAGVTRDMVQNHLMQMLALLTMEAPVSLDAVDIRNQKTNVLKTMEVVRQARGQYEGYRQEKDISPDSDTETFVEMELRIRNFRWAGVPIYIRSGKALGRKGTEIGIRFRSTPRILYNNDGGLKANSIVFYIQPLNGIVINHAVKVPGSDKEIIHSQLDFSLSDEFANAPMMDAYQRLLMDALAGDPTLYVSAKETEQAWKVLENAPDVGKKPFLYRKGEMPHSPLEIDWIDFSAYKGRRCGARPVES